MASFHDHFSTIAADYARFRPRYPASLFTYLAAVCRHHDHAWDCATGSGQAAVGLADHFARVTATDASAGQILHAISHPRVTYRVAPADASGLDAESCDLVTVAQAMHWLDAPAFFREARRVARAGSIVAVWGYERMICHTPAIQEVFDRFNDEVVRPYWPPQRVIVEDGYRSLAFPFDEFEAPAFELEGTFTVETLARHVGTWSATNRYRQATGEDPVPAFQLELQRVWPADHELEPVRWPGAMRIGHRR